jgi:acetyl-CoA carboxylase beta subunit
MPKYEPKDLFCYRCIKTVRPRYKHATSEYHFDVDNLPIESNLPHCPICGREVYSKDLARHVYEFKLYTHNKQMTRQMRLQRMKDSKVMNHAIQ